MQECRQQQEPTEATQGRLNAAPERRRNPRPSGRGGCQRLTPAEKRYIRAMAELGAGPHRTGAIAEVLKRPVSSLAPVRANLIRKGMIWGPSHGDTAFTVPLFEDFVQRVMPGDSWRAD